MQPRVELESIIISQFDSRLQHLPWSKLYLDLLIVWLKWTYNLRFLDVNLCSTQRLKLFTGLNWSQACCIWLHNKNEAVIKWHWVRSTKEPARIIPSLSFSPVNTVGEDCFLDWHASLLVMRGTAPGTDSKVNNVVCCFMWNISNRGDSMDCFDTPSLKRSRCCDFWRQYWIQ